MGGDGERLGNLLRGYARPEVGGRPSRGAAPALEATEPALLRAFMDAHTGEELRGGGAARPETAADDGEAEEPDYGRP